MKSALRKLLIGAAMGIFLLVHCILFGCGNDDDNLSGGAPA